MFDYFHDEQVDDGTDKEKTKLYGFKDPVGDYPAAEPRPLLVSDEP